MNPFQIVVSIGLFILILGVLVLVHEVGHFVVARRAGVRVHEFGIGFPPRAAVIRSGGETLYTLNWLPLGGFVRLEGEDGDSDDPRSFVRARFWTKQLILVSGVVMNLALAFVLMTGIAWLANPTTIWTIGVVESGSPAEAAGLQAGDRIVSLDGEPFDSFEIGGSLSSRLRAEAGEEVILGVVHTDGSTEGVTTTLRTPDDIPEGQGALGIRFSDASASGSRIERSLPQAIVVGAERTVEALGLIVTGLTDLVTSMVTRPTEQPPAAGPIGIATQIGLVFWEEGIVPTIYLAAILSANLALVNALPFPPLDGGRMLILAIKGVAGRRLSVRVERLMYLVGGFLLLGFIAWISIFDVVRLGGGAP
ncbi:MAG TPA: M50 family metallopeptidase [Candidatus Limnocylindrales bacterium]|nr:M50 family metallopeptidase [Candidatus Limnocylindrales bacterium]